MALLRLRQLGEHRVPLYVETLIRADLDRLWFLTQDPATHQRWDLRFSRISYLPRPDPGMPQEFTYAIDVGPLSITGTGRTLGERHRDDGTRTSALGFASPHPCSPIAEGRGYWRYVPTADGVRFLTGYDYRPRWGLAGEAADRWLIRPAMGWATAWSFDRLRLWAEQGLTPERARRRALGSLAARTLAGVGVGVVARRSLPRVPALVTTLAASLVAWRLPPGAGVPAARRCRRRAPDRVSTQAPETLEKVGTDR